MGKLGSGCPAGMLQLPLVVRRWRPPMSLLWKSAFPPGRSAIAGSFTGNSHCRNPTANDHEGSTKDPQGAKALGTAVRSYLFCE